MIKNSFKHKVNLADREEALKLLKSFYSDNIKDDVNATYKDGANRRARASSANGLDSLSTST